MHGDSKCINTSAEAEQHYKGNIFSKEHYNYESIRNTETEYVLAFIFDECQKI